MNGSTDSYASTGSSSGYPDQYGADEALQQTAQQTLGVLSDSLNAAKDQVCQVWDDMRPQLDKVAAYAKEEPTKSVLMAAAAGAVLVTVVMSANRSRRVDLDDSRKFLRSFANDTADRAREAAEDAQGPVRRTVSDYVSTAADEAKSLKERALESAKSLKETAVESTRRAASQAYDGASDRLHGLREKADPLIEQIQPQIENVAGYTKRNPFAALVAAAVLGALLSRASR